MKNNIGITVAAIGLLLSISGPTLFEQNQFLKYTFLGLGVLLAIYGAYKADKERKLN
ncbi:hypothetical protein [Salinimicrobium sediminilitoris]|uniref:hypothetical protein n=1 Tax=Salinimicrobium sediminilitoris TaxID=2876715 RepID=UPI001E2FC0A4|nr:hypothetical protein [Salinimicrobium sediminilitoris]MCC8358920.1 hypothetical protein [Salinimicrobium sediminilitoris]